METPETEVHHCSFCHEPVPQHGPLFHCISCVDYNLCAPCRRSARSSGGHREDHLYQRIQTGVWAQGSPPPVGGQAQLEYTGSPNPFWGRVITKNRTASERFGRLIDSIYSFISWNREPRNGNLEPEKASYIMTLLDYPNQDNIFHLFLTGSTQHTHGLAWSDSQTLFIYQQSGWEYQEGTRYHSQQIANAVSQYGRGLTPVQQVMPLLTSAGFKDMMVTEALADPEVFARRFNALLQKINGSQRVLRDLEGGGFFPVGPIESNCWPLHSDRESAWTRAMMQETARAAIDSINTREAMNAPLGTDWHPHGSL